MPPLTSAPLRLPPFQPAFGSFHQRVGIAPQQAAEVEELDHVQAAVAILHLGHKRLRPPQTLGHLLLCCAL